MRKAEELKQLQNRTQAIIKYLASLAQKDEGSREHQKMLRQLDMIDRMVTKIKGLPHREWF